jgi:HAD superfamily hydrolase (TIGR01459 family)
VIDRPSTSDTSKLTETSVTPATLDIPIVATIGDIKPAPMAWLCDIWGVLHNGVTAFPKAIAACQAYRRSGGLVLLVSNAPRPASAVAEQFVRLSIPRDAYDHILTSGDVARGLLVSLADRPLHHIGPDRDVGLFAGLGVTRVAAHDAEHIVCTGLFDDTRETAEDYRQGFVGMVARGLPMLCANPDLSVDRGGQIIACAGALAALYADLGGVVRYAGKPHPEVYRAALAWVSTRAGRVVSPADVLAIGDGVFTDIQGASAEAIASVYIASSVYLKEPFSSASVARLFAGRDFRPNAAMPELQ